MITTVIFDLDDTLYDEIEYCKSGFDAVAEFLAQSPATPPDLERKKIFTALFDEFTAGNRKTTFNTALDRLKIPFDQENIDELITIYRTHEPKIILPEQTKNTLDVLHPQYQLALLSDGFLPAQELKTKALKITEYFQSIVYTEQLGRQFWKPSPEGFTKILQDISSEPQNCVYVADDALKDFIAPNHLGITSIQITRPNRIHTENPPSEDAAPRHIITSLIQLPALLKGI